MKSLFAAALSLFVRPVAPAMLPQPLSAAQLRTVGGGLPRETWSAAKVTSQLPRETW
jgi:hypothetical protein